MTTISSVTLGGVLALVLLAVPSRAETNSEAFAREVERVLPEEKPYAYHERLSKGAVHVPRRNREAGAGPTELKLPDRGWKMVWDRRSSPVLQGAVRDFQDYLDTS